MDDFSYSASWTSSAPEPPRPSGPLERGLVAHRRGELEAAWLLYVQALQERPRRALAAYHLGLVQIDRGLGLSSLPFLMRARFLQPGDARYCQALLYAFLRSGRLAAVEDLLNECQDLGVALDAAPWRHWLASCRGGLPPSALQLSLPPIGQPDGVPEAADPASDLATETAAHAALKAPFAQVLASYHQGQFGTALAVLDDQLPTHPDWGEGHHLRGLCRVALGQLDRAAEALGRAARLLPGRAELWDHLGNVLGQLGDDEGVIRAHERSLALNPVRPETWSNAADAAIARERFSEGYQYALVALGLAPPQQEPPEPFVLNLGRAAKGLGRLPLARRAFLSLLGAGREHAGAAQQLGELCLESGDETGAVSYFERALAADPADRASRSSLIFLNNYLGADSQAGIYERAQQYAETLSLGVASRSSWDNPPDPGRTVRVGFVSGDLRSHPVGFFFLSVAQELQNRRGLELIAYPTTRKSDALTERIRACFCHWTPIAGLSDEEASAQILADRVDILVDLSGHTGGHRLGVFAQKPAPVQLTWLGYFGTTGLSQMDYLLAGPWDVPEEEESYFSERIWRLPRTRICFTRPETEIAVAPPPAAPTGRITFGCFNNLKKLNDRVVALWSRVLAAVPDAQLFLKNAQLDGEEVRAATAARFQSAGLDPRRLILEGRSPFQEYLAAYHRVDIALDPFPYTGGTTSIQALWMGVPLLTLAGDRLLARQGEGMLRALDLADWVAEDESAYLEKAVAFARSLDELAALRAGLRARLEASPLMDAGRFAADLEAAFRGIWSRWCDQTVRRGAPRTHTAAPEAEGGPP